MKPVFYKLGHVYVKLIGKRESITLSNRMGNEFIMHMKFNRGSIAEWDAYKTNRDKIVIITEEQFKEKMEVIYKKLYD